MARLPAWKMSVWNGMNCQAMMTMMVKRARLGLPIQFWLRKCHVEVDTEPGEPAELREKNVLPHEGQPRGGKQKRHQVDGRIDSAVALPPGDEYAEGHRQRGLRQPAEASKLESHEQGMMGYRVREETAPV